MVTELKTEPGQIHKNLVNNRCPKCERELTFVAITDSTLIRKCVGCSLTLHDPLEGGEYPDNVCEICD